MEEGGAQVPFLLAKVLLMVAAGERIVTFLRRRVLTMLQRITSYLYTWTAFTGLYRICNLKNIEDVKLGGDMERWVIWEELERGGDR